MVAPYLQKLFRRLRSGRSLKRTGGRGPVGAKVMDEILARAIQAFYIARRQEGVIAEQPNINDSGLERHYGKRYVVLRNSKGTLAVYRVRHGGSLKSLKRWPSILNIW